MMTMKERWARWVEEPHQEWTWLMLVSLYGEPGRAYHNMHHIEVCLGQLDQGTAVSGADRDAAELALWWHDAVYVPGDKRNEAMSAHLLEALTELLVVSSATVAHAVTCIFATRNHGHVAGMTALNVVVDIDLSILATAPEVYERYVRAIRKEYASVSDEAWRHGRSRFLAEMIAKPRIFSEMMTPEYNELARRNMREELRCLAAPSGE